MDPIPKKLGSVLEKNRIKAKLKYLKCGYANSKAYKEKADIFEIIGC